MNRADGAADTPRLLRIEDVAARLAVSRSMAWRLVASGDLRSIRIGGAIRIRPADLEAFIANQKHEGDDR